MTLTRTCRGQQVGVGLRVRTGHNGGLVWGGRISPAAALLHPGLGPGRMRERGRNFFERKAIFLAFAGFGYMIILA